MPQPSHDAAPLVSRFANDPEMARLLGFFLEELPVRVEAVKAAWAARELRLLGRLTHQLRGAGNGYGFPQIGEVAAKVQDGLRPGTPTDLARLDDTVRELVDLCSRACLGR